MQLKDFVGKIVLRKQKCYALYNITAPEIEIVSVLPDEHGHHTFWVYETINGDPITTGALTFEDPSLKEPFLEAYNAYCRTEDAYWEEYGYWMMRE